MCQKEFPDNTPEPVESCGACSGGCRKIHCPHCGYGNPVTPGFLKRLFNQSPEKD
ncbi:MAG: hypothetical protein IBX47_02250 [Desulfuromonadales bacterium]|nr:hypothetical protein [Desulfuromonadales bacterium]